MPSPRLPIQAGGKDASHSPVFNAYLERVQREYEKLSTTPDQYTPFFNQVTTMWATEPHFTSAQFARIRVPVWIVAADHDETIKRENTLFIADTISPNTALLIEAAVSHFAFLQDPLQFNQDVLHFLEG